MLADMVFCCIFAALFVIKVVKTHRPIDVGDINITYHAPAYGTVKKLHNSRGLGCKQNTNNA